MAGEPFESIKVCLAEAERDGAHCCNCANHHWAITEAWNASKVPEREALCSAFEKFSTWIAMRLCVDGGRGASRELVKMTFEMPRPRWRCEMERTVELSQSASVEIPDDVIFAESELVDFILMSCLHTFGILNAECAALGDAHQPAMAAWWLKLHLIKPCRMTFSDGAMAAAEYLFEAVAEQPTLLVFLVWDRWRDYFDSSEIMEKLIPGLYEIRNSATLYHLSQARAVFKRCFETLASEWHTHGPWKVSRTVVLSRSERMTDKHTRLDGRLRFWFRPTPPIDYIALIEALQHIHLDVFGDVLRLS